MAYAASRSFLTRRSLLTVARNPGISRTLAFPAARAWFSSYPPHEVVGMPSLSPTMESGSIAEWSVKEGDSFGAGDILATVETDKATVSLEAQDEGVVAKILAPAGPADIKLGEPILITVEEESDAGAFSDYVVEAGASADTPPSTTPEPAVATPPPQPVAPPEAPATTASTDIPVPTGRVVASPLAHTVAKGMGYDLASIAGTGPGGRIIAADVKEFVPPIISEVSGTAAPAAAAVPASAFVATPEPVVGAGYTDYPHSASSAEFASRLAQSKRNVPHYYLTVDVTLDQVLALRETLNATLPEDATISLNDLLIKAAATAMKTVPSANASWMDTAVRVYESIDINVVMGNGDSLFTPVVRNVGGRGVKSISDELRASLQVLEESTIDKEGGDTIALGDEFFSLGTFTVMNLGMYGVKSCAPIIREPQACALALGAAENRIVPNMDESSEDPYKESVMLTATMSCDHRVVDGAVGAQWLSAFKSLVENPSTLLL